MKKNILTLAFILCLCCLIACGNTENNSNTNANTNTNTNTTTKSDIGSRSNPYKIGDEIILNMCDYRDISKKYTLKVKFTEAYKEDDFMAMSSYYDAYKVAKCEFSLEGDYDDEIDTDFVFSITVLSEEMQPANLSMILVSNDDYIHNLYTGIDYNVYTLGYADNEYKYALIKYHSQETDEFENVYISLYE